MGVKTAVIIARAGPEAEAMRETLSDRYDAWADPPLIREDVPADPPPLADVGALLLTSPNGARRAAALWPTRPDTSVWAVGDATAAAARAAGFRDIRSAAGDSAALAAALIADPPAGAALHLAGADVAGDLAGALGRAGLTYRRLTVYRMAEAAALSAESAAALAERPTAILFYSPRGAAAFGAMARKAGLAGCGRAVCLSPKVADAARLAGWANPAIAAHPDAASLIVALDRVSQGEGMG